MFCRNCGHELGEDTLCRNCGFDGNDGNTHCPHCGKEVLPGQKLCLNCGFLIEEIKSKKEETEETPKKKKKKVNYKPYEPTVKKIHQMNLARQALAAAIMIVLLFVPIFKSTINIFEMAFNELNEFSSMQKTSSGNELLYADAEDVERAFKKEMKQLEKSSSEAMEELGKISADGTVEKNFSVFDDAKMLWDTINNEHASAAAKSVAKGFMMMIAFELLAVVILVATLIKLTAKSLDAMKDIGNTTLLEYNEMKKTGKKTRNLLDDEMRGMFLLFWMIVLDVLFVYFTKSIPAKAPTNLSALRYMTNMSGLSGYALILVGLIGAYIYVRIVQGNLKKNMLLRVTKEDYQEESTEE